MFTQGLPVPEVQEKQDTKLCPFRPNNGSGPAVFPWYHSMSQTTSFLGQDLHNSAEVAKDLVEVAPGCKTLAIDSLRPSMFDHKKDQKNIMTGKALQDGEELVRDQIIQNVDINTLINKLPREMRDRIFILGGDCAPPDEFVYRVPVANAVVSAHSSQETPSGLGLELPMLASGFVFAKGISDGIEKNKKVSRRDLLIYTLLGIGGMTLGKALMTIDNPVTAMIKYEMQKQLIEEPLLKCEYDKTVTLPGEEQARANTLVDPRNAILSYKTAEVNRFMGVSGNDSAIVLGADHLLSRKPFDLNITEINLLFQDYYAQIIDQARTDVGNQIKSGSSVNYQTHLNDWTEYINRLFADVTCMDLLKVESDYSSNVNLNNVDQFYFPELLMGIGFQSGSATFNQHRDQNDTGAAVDLNDKRIKRLQELQEFAHKEIINRVLGGQKPISNN